MWFLNLLAGGLVGAVVAVATIVLTLILRINVAWYLLAAFWLLSSLFSVMFFARLRTQTPEVLKARNEQALADWQNNGYANVDDIVKSVFFASKPDGTGRATAFLLEGDVVVTNYHVARVRPEMVVRTKSGFTATLARHYMGDPDQRPDLAFYEATGLGAIPALPLATEPPKVGEKLLIIGQNGRRDEFYPSVVEVVAKGRYADGLGTRQSLVTRITRAADIAYRARFGTYKPLGQGAKQATVYAYNGDTGPGNSGSPVVNSKGEVVGVHFSGRKFYWFASEHTGWAVDLATLSAELKIAYP